MQKSQKQQVLPALSEHPWEDVPPAVAAVLRPGIAALAEEIIAAIGEGVPAYARPLEGAFGRGVRTGVERALEQFVDMVERPGRPFAERDVYVALGRGEAREGRTMEALLAAYRVGARVAWRRIAATGREAGLDAETLSLLAESIFAYIDELSAQSAEGWAAEVSAAAGELERRRGDLVERLIEGPPREPAAIEAAAAEVAWELPATVGALAWREPDERRGPPALPPGTIAASLDDGVTCALVPDAEAPGRRAELERAMRRRVAAVGPAVPWVETWRSAQRALAALQLAEHGLVEPDGLLVAGEHLGELVVHADPELLGELAARRLAPLRHRPPAAQARLIDTLAAWLAHQGRVPEVAAALHIHRQTVRYRLAQLREDLGEDLDDPGARFELALALRAGALDSTG